MENKVFLNKSVEIM